MSLLNSRSLDDGEMSITAQRRAVLGQVDIGCDYILPDYMGDVKKMISSSANIMPGRAYKNGDSVNVNGDIEYRILYIDQEGKLTEARVMSEYEYCIKVSEGYVDCRPAPEIVSLNVRAAGPRKLSVKATLAPAAYIIEMMTLQVGTVPENAEKKCKDFKVHKALYLPEREFEYAEEGARLDGVSSEEVELVCGDGRVEVKSAVPKDEGVEVEGVIHLYAIMSVEDGDLVRVEKKLDFKELVSYGEEQWDAEGAYAIAKGTVTSFKVTENNEISEDTERAGCSVVFNVIMELCVGVDGELTVTLPKDAYMTDRETEAGYATVRLSSLCDSFTSGHTVSYEIPKDELFPGCAAEILLIEGAPKVASVKVRDGMLAIDGSMQYSILAKGTEGEMLGAKLTRPLTINEKIDTKECDIIRAATALAVGEESCTVDANTAYISSRINLCAVVTCERPVEYLNSLSVGDPIPPNDKCRVYVYYPDRDDTIWSVAKKYKVRMARILQDNMIPRVEGVDDSDLPLADMERIIITKI